MTSEEEFERTLLNDDVEGTEGATAAESMPKVMSGLSKTLATISTAIKRIRLSDTSDSEGTANKSDVEPHTLM